MASEVKARASAGCSLGAFVRSPAVRGGDAKNDVVVYSIKAAILRPMSQAIQVKAPRTDKQGM